MPTLHNSAGMSGEAVSPGLESTLQTCFGGWV
jgi:hypothetical protein